MKGAVEIDSQVIYPGLLSTRQQNPMPFFRRGADSTWCISGRGRNIQSIASSPIFLFVQGFEFLHFCQSQKPLPLEPNCGDSLHRDLFRITDITQLSADR